jgi:hypothetical protein
MNFWHFKRWPDCNSSFNLGNFHINHSYKFTYLAWNPLMELAALKHTIDIGEFHILPSTQEHK